MTGIAARLPFDHPDDPAARDLLDRIHGYGRPAPWATCARSLRASRCSRG